MVGSPLESSSSSGWAFSLAQPTPLAAVVIKEHSVGCVASPAPSSNPKNGLNQGWRRVGVLLLTRGVPDLHNGRVKNGPKQGIAVRLCHLVVRPDKSRFEQSHPVALHVVSKAQNVKAQKGLEFIHLGTALDRIDFGDTDHDRIGGYKSLTDCVVVRESKLGGGRSCVLGSNRTLARVILLLLWLLLSENVVLQAATRQHSTVVQQQVGVSLTVSAGS